MRWSLPGSPTLVLASTLTLAVFLIASPSSQADGSEDDGAPSRPNVLLIMADDLGYSDLGCYGGEIQTPHLDRLAEGGIRFTNFYNTGRCWPTRGSLMTGYYAQSIRRDKIPGVPSGAGNKNRRPKWAELLPAILKPAGYRSYHVGKWHIDGKPIAEGFDRSYWLDDQSRFFHPTRHFLDDVQLPAVPADTDFYATTELADRAIAMLDQHQREHSDQPFFQYLAFAAPHFPLHALPEDIAIYRQKYTAGWDAIRQSRWQRIQEMGLLVSLPRPSRVETQLGPPYHFPDALNVLGQGELNRPKAWKSLTGAQKNFQSEKMAIHAAMIHRMDIEIGRVLEKIKAMGQRENTLVVFLSDNGASAEIMVRGDGHDPSAEPGSADTYLCLGPGWSTVANTPFRRHKTWTHEGGISTPLIVSWPRGIESVGEIRATPAHVIDLSPTVIELAGANFSTNAPPPPGKSLVPVFSQDVGSLHDDLWWYHDGHRAIRQGRWKAVSPLGEPWELYDLSVDRAESIDLAVAKPKKLASLVKLWSNRLNQFREMAIKEFPEKRRQQIRASPLVDQPGSAQQLAMPQRTQKLINGKPFLLGDRHAFVMEPNPETTDPSAIEKPWIFYAPTLSPYPDGNESWMHRRFLDAGVAVAGIDVGETYGSPLAFPHFENLYRHMIANGYSKTPALLGRSRGGLSVSSWAIANPDRVAAIGGIYPVFDYTSYPGTEKAAIRYDVSQQELSTNQSRWNPIKSAGKLSDAEIPIWIIHGTADKLVPIGPNSEAMETAYLEGGKSNLLRLVRAEGQGHSAWQGFFESQELVDFLIHHAKAKSLAESASQP